MAANLEQGEGKGSGDDISRGAANAILQSGYGAFKGGEKVGKGGQEDAPGGDKDELD